MNYVLAVFRSRTHTLAFVEEMRAQGISCLVVQTPPEAHAGCGISARFYFYDLNNARRIINRYGYRSFSGFYELILIAGKTVVRRMAK